MSVDIYGKLFSFILSILAVEPLATFFVKMAHPTWMHHVSLDESSKLIEGKHDSLRTTGTDVWENAGAEKEDNDELFGWPYKK